MQIYNGRESFYQWDIDQKITSTDFAVGDEIHFHNLKQSTALVVRAYELNGKVVADVPNILLQSSHSLTAYRYFTDKNGQYTIDEQIFSVRQRAKPDDYVYTETEVLNYNTLDKRITTLEENGGSGGGIMDETDPTVPDWAKQPTKPTYTADEVGAYTKSEVDVKIGTVESQTEIIKTDVEGIQKQINEHAHFKGYKATNAEILEIEATLNDFAYSAESGTKWIYSEDGWQDSGAVVPDQLTPPSELTPLMDGEASVGESETYARGDHRHPTDTTRVGVAEFNAFKSELEVGLDRIIAIQDSLIGGGSE